MDPAVLATRIVLAEDNAADIGLVREALREHELQCDLQVISDGEAVVQFIEGLEKNKNLPCPDLLLLDLHLPKCDGAEILERLRASERCRRTPVVILTSSSSPRDRQDAEKFAALHYFQKPSKLVDFMKLGAIIKALLSAPNHASSPAQGNGASSQEVRLPSADLPG